MLSYFEIFFCLSLSKLACGIQDHVDAGYSLAVLVLINQLYLVIQKQNL